MTPRKKSDFQILVVEDDEDIRSSLAQVLADEGHAVSVAQNGHAALSLLHAPGSQIPDLILLDLMMPVMDGMRFLDEQARDSALAHVPVLIISATGILDRKRVPPGLTVRVLRKPFALEALMAIVESFQLSSSDGV